MKQPFNYLTYLFIILALSLSACAPSPNTTISKANEYESRIGTNATVNMTIKGAHYVMTELCLLAQSQHITPADGTRVMKQFIREHRSFFEDLYRQNQNMYDASVKLIAYIAMYTVVKVQSGTDPMWLLTHEDEAIEYVMGLIRNGELKVTKGHILPPDKLLSNGALH